MWSMASEEHDHAVQRLEAALVEQNMQPEVSPRLGPSRGVRRGAPGPMTSGEVVDGPLVIGQLTAEEHRRYPARRRDWRRP